MVVDTRSINKIMATGTRMCLIGASTRAAISMLHAQASGWANTIAIIATDRRFSFASLWLR